MQSDRFCPRCGAYIPEGETKCLACGINAPPTLKPAQAFDGVDLMRILGKNDCVRFGQTTYLRCAHVEDATWYGNKTDGSVCTLTLKIVGVLSKEQ